MKVLLGPKEITKSMIEVGKKKVSRNNVQMLILGILAGAFIAVGAFTANVVSHNIDNYGLFKFIQGAVFPVGLILVLVAGADLFTGNTLIFLAVLDKKVTIKELLNNWVLIYIGNFIGSIIFVYLIYYSGLFNTSAGELGALHVKIAASKVNLNFMQIFIRAILANFLVCLAVWMSVGAQDMMGKVAACWFPIMAFVASGFEHSIANMYYIPAGILAKAEFAQNTAISVSQLANLNLRGLFYNLLPATLGNIIGGGILISLAYWKIFRGYRS
ncbi:MULTISPECIES: formate/nitrite transporter family protein [unclassified Halanaerobium]|uniref:formate/nitrite transporter family protein n=1 Tax=unclassified Halanaerobium TaxID=2641197 RepID=UPI000DF164BB|nr:MULTISPECIES: formate/nitrite transporter family protein [unclassified Halanaerobium]RCW46335.1 formate/nitrite transporter [Halanaerobium sp. MA284_MarDTE_T2]RCW82543.1 formate/nitrite transporter [Halanaerobium sp. DL-01]